MSVVDVFKRLLSQAELAAAIGLPPKTVGRWIASGWVRADPRSDPPAYGYDDAVIAGILCELQALGATARVLGAAADLLYRFVTLGRTVPFCGQELAQLILHALLSGFDEDGWSENRASITAIDQQAADFSSYGSYIAALGMADMQPKGAIIDRARSLDLLDAVDLPYYAQLVDRGYRTGPTVRDVWWHFVTDFGVVRVYPALAGEVIDLGDPAEQRAGCRSVCVSQVARRLKLPVGTLIPEPSA